MSVFLLQNNQHVHQILDDRESAFHVLTWSALRYTAHSHQDDVGPQMKPYDEVDVHRDGNVKGGFRKELMIRKPLEVTFYPPALHELIDDLRILFCERYRELTSDARKFPLGSRNPSQFYATIEAEHRERCEAMRTRSVFEYVFRQRLASGDWSGDRAAQENYIRKRKALDPPTGPCRSSKSRKSNPPTNSSQKSDGSSRK